MVNNFEVIGQVVYIELVDKDKSIMTTMVDLEDLPKLQKYNFKWTKTKSGYVITSTKEFNGSWEIIALHRYLMDTPKGLVVDHINFNKLDNRKSINLRNVTQSENIHNRECYKNNKSGYLGVSWNKNNKCWTASCSVNGKIHYLGSFKDKEEAATVVVKFRAANLPTSKEFRDLSKYLDC